MLKAQRATSIALMMALDAAALLLAFFLVWQLRAGFGEFLVSFGKTLGYNTSSWVRYGAKAASNSDWRQIAMSPNPMVNLSRNLWVLYFTLFSWGALLQFQHGYDLNARRNSRQEFALCAYTGILGTIALLAFIATLQWSTSRLFIGGLLIFGVLSLWLARVLVAPLAQKAAKPRRNVLLIGPSSAATRYAQMIDTPAYQWSRLIGFIADVPEREEGGLVKHLGTLAELPHVLDSEVVDEVVLVRSAETERGPNWGNILELCLERGRTVSLVEDIAPPTNAKVEATMLGQMPVLTLHNTPQRPLALAIKNVMDRALAAIMLVLLAPLFVVLAILIKRHDNGPVFYSQERVGLNGRRFKFYKFRSMDVNAAEILETMKRENRAYYDSINVMEDPFFKAPDDKDPRITPIGRIMRKTSIDELPQFWNVLKGDMSLVGPRPPLPKEVAELEPWHRRKLSVKGGLTCIWQASGRNDITDVDEWMRMDLEYIDNWSLWLDVKLLLKTMKSVVKGSGAS
jgi:exopolysaccharide biosynthesis polyprenyl glycosylphosphotransferase